MSSPGRAPARYSATPGGTSPSAVTLMVSSGPRVVSPPTRSTPWRSASAKKPRANAASQRFVRRRQRERERRPARRRAHRGEVGKVDRERLVAERLGVGAGQEMPAFDQHVGGDRQLQAGVGPQQRAIVADPHQRVPGGPIEEAADDFEFVQTLVRVRATSSGRSATAIFSSTPLTKRWPSVAPKLLPSSIASFSTTLNGVFGCASSS